MDPQTKPRFAPGCRLHKTEPMLLVPEGALKLVGSSRDILSRVNGQTTVAEIAAELAANYPATDAGRIQQEVAELLDRLHTRGVIKT